MLGDKLVAGQPGIYLGSGNISVPHYLLERAGVAAVVDIVFAKSMPDPVGPHLGTADAGLTHVSLDKVVDCRCGQWPPLTLKDIIGLAIISNQSQEEPSGFFADRNFPLARLAVYLDVVIKNVVLAQGSELTHSSPTVNEEAEHSYVSGALYFSEKR